MWLEIGPNQELEKVNNEARPNDLIRCTLRALTELPQPSPGYTTYTLRERLAEPMLQLGLLVRTQRARNKRLTPDREIGQERDVLQGDRHLTPSKVEGVRLGSPPVDKCRQQAGV